MPLTNFPQGVTSFGVPLPAGSTPFPAGNVYFVSSVSGQDATTRGRDRDTPFRTLNYAVTRTRADKGDVIYVLPGHQEPITTAGGVTVNKAGLTIVGLGNGSARPLFALSGVVGASFLISAAQVTIDNLGFTATGVDAIVAPVSITAADCTVKNCRFVTSNSTNQAVSAITLSGTADRAQISNNTIWAVNVGATAAIYTATALNELYVIGNYITGEFSAAAINNATNAITNCLIKDNIIRNMTSTIPGIALAAAATGIIMGNRIWGNTLTAGGAAASIVAAAAAKFDNLATDSVANTASQGILDPTALAAL